MKAREQDKSAIQLLEKKIIDIQAKKNELEKELNAEKRNKIKEEHAAARALAAAQSNKYVFNCLISMSGSSCRTAVYIYIFFGEKHILLVVELFSIIKLLINPFKIGMVALSFYDFLHQNLYIVFVELLNVVKHAK